MGAVIASIDKRGQTRGGPDSRDQLDQLKDIRHASRIDTILLTIGGNDIHFADKLKHCYLVGNVSGCLNDPKARDSELQRLRGELARAYREIVSSSDGARLLVVGYPDIFPPANHSDRCLWLTRGMKSNIEEYSRRLDETIAGASKDAGVSYVSTRDVLKEHWLCTGQSGVFGANSKCSAGRY